MFLHKIADAALVLLTLSCPLAAQTWIKNPANGHYYTLLSPNTWQQHESLAVVLGGHLATVRSKPEHDWIWSTFGSNGTRNLNIGLSDSAKEGSWVWTSGETSTYRPWCKGEPSNRQSEDWVHMKATGGCSGGWNDHDGTDKTFFGVAERKTAPPSSSATTWINESTKVPSARSYHAMVYDSARNEMLLFGGFNGGNLGDTWTRKAGVWTEQKPSQSPSARHGMAMVYDSARQRVVLFGGSSGGNMMNDTWEWNGSTWTNLTPSNSPATRHFHRMAYDSKRMRTVLFGGNKNGTFLNDTWEWNGTLWVQMSTGTTPVVRQDPGIAYDSRKGLVLMFGGLNSKGHLADSWTWDGVKWTPLITLGNFPSARRGSAMVFDASRNCVVLFGGYDGKYLFDTWEWDWQIWRQKAPLMSPSPRFDAAYAYDSAQKRVFLHGGDIGVSSFSNETWSYTTAARLTRFGEGCGGNPPVSLDAVQGSFPITGKTFQLATTNAPTTSSVAVMSLGVSKAFLGPFPLPLNLTTFGMPGCTLYNSYDLLWVYGMTNGAGVFSMPLPNNPKLLGKSLFVQAMVLASKSNAAGLLASNGGEMTIWNQ